VAELADLWALCAAEAQATESRRRAGDLKVRAALLKLDADGDWAGARALVDKVDHPLAYSLQLGAALALADDVGFHDCVADARRRHDRDDLADLAGLSLFRKAGATTAAELVRLVGDDVPLLTRLALLRAGAHAELVDFLARPARAGDDEADLLAVAAWVADSWLPEAAERTKVLLQRAEEAARKKSTQVGYLPSYLHERLCTLGGDTAQAWRARLSSLTELHRAEGTAVELRSARFALAAAQEKAGQLPEAAETLATLRAEMQELEPSELTAMLIARADLRVVSAQPRSPTMLPLVAAAYERMAGVQTGQWATGYLRRAAELYLAAGQSDEAVRVLGKQPDTAGEGIVTQRVLAEVSADRIGAAATALGAYGRARDHEGLAALGLAARAAEVSGAPAAELADAWRLALGDERGRPDRNALEALARAQRRAGQRAELAKTYCRLGAVLDARRGSAYLAVAGALYLELGQLVEAEQAFAEAATREPEDLLIHAGRAGVFERSGKKSEQIAALNALVGLLRSREAKGRIHRLLAETAERANDAATAQVSYERAIELEPDDVVSLRAYARVCVENSRWPRAVELLERVAALSTGAEAAAVLVEIGELQTQRLNDDQAGLDASERALANQAGNVPALVALTTLHQKHRRIPKLLETLRLRLVAEPERELELQLEIAHAAEEPTPGAAPLPNGTQIALAAYRDALRLDPANQPALSGFERLCLGEGRNDLLVEVLRRTPPTARTLRAIGQALEALERWEELADVRERELAASTEPKDVARVARQLASLYETRLGNLDAAARAWHRLDEADAKDGEAVRALQRIYEARSRFPELAAAIERELSRDTPSSVDSGDVARRLELWLKLGELRQSKLRHADSAAEAYEKALELDAHNAEALTALAALYASQQRPLDLDRVLDLKAAATSEPGERSAVLLQKAELLEQGGDLLPAQRAFAEAFSLDPANRASFTAYERICYRREDWAAALELYHSAIRLVEVQKSRAYRLADLYARRGQLQLQYLADVPAATSSYLKVLELDPESDTAQSALERIHAGRSEWVPLIAAYQRRATLVRDDAKRVEILRRAARVAGAKLRDPVETARLYRALHAVDPTDAEALDALERQAERDRDWDGMVSLLTTRLSLTVGGDESIALYMRIAQLCEEGLRDADRAIGAYHQVLQISPSHKEAVEALGRLYEGTERWAELVEITRRQIRVVTDRAQKALLYFKCGSVMESKFANEDDAIRYYDAAIKTSPSCLPAVHGLRDLHLRRQDWSRVIQTLELEAKLWTEDKERAGVFAHIGQIYGGKLDNEERAIQYYESALTVDKECLPANRALFELYFQRGEYLRALPIAVILTQKVTREGDPVERSEFYRKRAIVAEETGDARAAAESLVVALEIRPENLDALDRLVALCRRYPGAYDFTETFHELDKLFRKRGPEQSAQLARVLVAEGSLREHLYEIEGAEQSYLEALKIAPGELRVVEALVSLHEKLRRFDAGAVVLEAFIERVEGVELLPTRSAARLRLAELYLDGAMDPRRAALTLEELLEEDPQHRAGLYQLAQALYLLGKFGEAQRACQRLIEVSAAPNNTAPAEEVGRYYAYLGRIAEANGDGASALRAYRRAVDLDPGYAPAVLSLARRQAVVVPGMPPDPRQAHALVEQAVDSARMQGWEASERPLRRGLARFYQAMGDPGRAASELRRILSHSPESHDDRASLAELLAANPATISDARHELMSVLNTDLRHLPSYQLLLQLYQRAQDPERAARVSGVLAFLGFADPGDRGTPFRPSVRRGTLTEELRRSRLHASDSPEIGAARALCTEALMAVREAIDLHYPIPAIVGAVPAAQLPDPGFKVCVIDTLRMFGSQAEVFVAREVPSGCLVVESPRPAVYLSTALVDRDDGERRFFLGRALEPLRGGYSLLARLGAVGGTAREEVIGLIDQLCRRESEREPQTQEFIRSLPRKTLKALERVSQLAEAQTQAGIPTSATEWAADLELAADRAGLLACDDVSAAARALAFLSGGDLLLPEATLDAALQIRTLGGIALGQPASAEHTTSLLRFFLSDAYHDLRTSLGPPA